MEVGLYKKVKVARNYIKFLRTFKRCGTCYTLARTYKAEPDKMGELKEKLCPNCAKSLKEAGEAILKDVNK